MKNYFLDNLCLNKIDKKNIFLGKQLFFGRKNTFSPRRHKIKNIFDMNFDCVISDTRVSCKLMK